MDIIPYAAIAALLILLVAVWRWKAGPRPPVRFQASLSAVGEGQAVN